MKTGLVLEGGGMRGLYTIGVLDFFMDKGIRVDYVIGVSAGACNGVSYVAGQRGRSLRVNTNYIRDNRYLSARNFVKTKSLFGMDFLFDEIPNKLEPFDYQAFQDAPCAFVTGVTDVETGQPVYFDKSHLTSGDCTVLRASSSIPIFSPMVEYQGRKYLDGGTADPIPVKRALADGCDKVVVVRTRHRDYVKTPESFRRLYYRIFRRYPNMAKVLDRRHLVYNASLSTLKTLEGEGKALVIAPSTTLPVGRFEKRKERLEAIYQLGMDDARAILPALKAFLNIEDGAT